MISIKRVTGEGDLYGQRIIFVNDISFSSTENNPLLENLFSEVNIQKRLKLHRVTYRKRINTRLQHGSAFGILMTEHEKEIERGRFLPELLSTADNLCRPEKWGENGSISLRVRTA